MTHKTTKVEAGEYEYRGWKIELTDSGNWNVYDETRQGVDTTNTKRAAKRCIDWNLDTEFGEDGAPV